MYGKSSGVSDSCGQMPAVVIVVITMRSPRTFASTSSAARCVINVIGSLRQQSHASLEQAGTLDHDDWLLTAQPQARRHRERLALAADAHQRQPRRRGQRGLPGAQLAVGNPNDVRDAAVAEGGGYCGAVEHRTP